MKKRVDNMISEIYDMFVEDYNNPQLTIDDISRKYSLNCRRFSELQTIAIQNGDIPKTRHMNRTGAKFYTKNKKGEYLVKKTFGTECKVIGRFEEETTAQLVVNKCKEVNWNIEQITDFIEAHKIQPRNYTHSKGYYIVQKVINGKNTVFCKVDSETTAQKVVNELRKCNWDKTKTNEIIEKVKT